MLASLDKTSAPPVAACCAPELAEQPEAGFLGTTSFQQKLKKVFSDIDTSDRLKERL